MKKNTYIGVNGNKCCVLYSIASFEQLLEANSIGEIESSDFVHDSTNWCGRDDIDRTCKFKNFDCTGRNIVLASPIIFYGSDYDYGRVYDWAFEVKEIWEVEYYEDET